VNTASSPNVNGHTVTITDRGLERVILDAVRRAITKLARDDDVVEVLLASRHVRRAIIEQARAEGHPLSNQALSEWRHLRHGVPPARVMTVARVTGIPPHRIRPDIFPAEEVAR
jgi:DNA-binding transcriptional regulator YdaS (Cro superfamily)